MGNFIGLGRGTWQRCRAPRGCGRRLRLAEFDEVLEGVVVEAVYAGFLAGEGGEETGLLH